MNMTALMIVLTILLVGLVVVFAAGIWYARHHHKQTTARIAAVHEIVKGLRDARGGKPPKGSP